ncbi:S1C family serine protease [Alteribacter natronophilus]|uniref:S1C family serine protease n=1 Tax=Alteribacter natronophilus TaxID=2583810 RepID=UPI00110EEAB7|nr:serine protease [Alteribacter natronophilus]TMW73406.1 trypsin-like peptidase domain-containing protein [Alteribacter natronophilus]
MNGNSREPGDTEQNREEPERPYFDGERYYTKEEFFNPRDEEEAPEKKKTKRRVKKVAAAVIIIALLGNVLAFIPRLVNIPAVEFLTVSRELSQSEDVQAYRESVVVVRGENNKGTGFLFSEDGYIMTNDHVIEGEPFLTVTFENGDRYQAQVTDTHESLDLAVLKIDGEPGQPNLEFSRTWSADESVIIIGNPLFFNFIANQGEILGERSDGAVLLDAPVYRGNSGSPVINEDGSVIGVVYATTRTEFRGETVRAGLFIPFEAFSDFTEDR